MFGETKEEYCDDLSELLNSQISKRIIHISNFISESDVIFCTSAEEKVEVIKAKDFDIFVDDLIEILLDLELTSSLNRVLFESSTNQVLLRDDGIYSSNFVSLTQWI